MRIECPHCDTSYPIERTCLKAEAGVRFTIVCSVCGHDFDGSIREEPALPEVVTIIKGTAAVPASWVNRGTFGLVGRAEVPAVADQTYRTPGSPAFLVVDTRKRP